MNQIRLQDPVGRLIAFRQAAIDRRKQNRAAEGTIREQRIYVSLQRAVSSVPTLRYLGWLSPRIEVEVWQISATDLANYAYGDQTEKHATEDYAIYELASARFDELMTKYGLKESLI